ncbi:MAG: hypothetical protein KatS3mg104_1287 [Phycisphaerae bacterium]|jgi:hypothetical protein|nr:MAG: hypothetical protein KatS3mg104_1287 [Phycisphaerae bacterium]
MIARGLTLIEMCLGIAITAMTGMAIVGFMMTATQTWQATEEGLSLDLSSRQAGTILGQVIETSKALGLVDSSRKGLLIWQDDAYNGLADGKVQLAELAMIQYDPETSSLWLLVADPAKTASAGTEPSEVIPTEQLNRTSVMDQFASRSWLSHRLILGPGENDGQKRSFTRVDSVELIPLTRSGLPGFEMNLTLSRGNEQQDVKWVCVVRGPVVRPDYANPKG